MGLTANKQIGWSQESNLLHSILKQIERLTGVISISGGGGATTLGSLSDVTLTAPVPGDVLTYNGSEWVNYPPSAGVPAGSDTEVQFNDGGLFGADPAFTYSVGVLTIPTLNLSAIPVNDNLLSQILVRDGVTGEVKYRDVSSIEASTASNGLHEVGNDIRWGGLLTEPVVIDGNSLYPISLTNLLSLNFSGGVAFAGAQYAANYAANYTLRSLVDKEYVDTAIIGVGVPLTRTLGINGVVQNLSANRTWQTGYADTGLLSFAGLSPNSNTTINIGAATGWVVDNETNPGVPTSILVNYAGALNVPVPSVGAAPASYVLLNSAGAVVFQTTLPTSTQRKENIWLGKVAHPVGIITTVLNEPDFITSPMAFSRDLFQAIGPYINENVFASPNGANLSLNISNGNIYGNGINFAGGIPNRKNPDKIQVGPIALVPFLLRTQTGAGGAAVTIMDVANYDLAGVVTPVAGGVNRASLRYIFYVPGGGFVVQYGQAIYPTIADAISAIGKEAFVVFSNLPGNSILIGVLAVIRTATNLSDPTQAKFFNADKFGQLIPGTSAGLPTFTASNGLSMVVSDVQLGGVLTQNTTIAQAGFNFVFTGAGNVGIGLTNPANRLDISTPNDGVLGISTDGATGNPAIVIKQAGVRKGVVQWINADGLIVQSDADNLNLSAGGQTRLRILSGGNVGIGTLTPSAPLDVRGSTTAGGGMVFNAKSTDSHAIAYLDAFTAFSPFLRFRVNGVDKWSVGYLGTGEFQISDATAGRNRLMINAAGAFGIDPGPSYGTAGQVLTSGGPSAPPSWTTVSGGGGSPAGSTGQVQFNNAGAFGASTNLFWDSSNNRLGIGIATPTEKLDVVGNIHATGGIISRVSSSTGLVSLNSGDATNLGYVAWYTPAFLRLGYMGFDAGGVGNLGIKLENSANFSINGGNVGIGTAAPTRLLTVNGHIGFSAFVTDVDDYGLYVVNGVGMTMASAGSTNIALRTNNTEKVRITPSGNVGIGTNNPLVPLHISTTTGNAIRVQSTNLGAYMYEAHWLTGANGNYFFIRQQPNFILMGSSTLGSGTLKGLGFTLQGGDTEADMKMVIATSGNIGIGTPAPSSYSHGGTNRYLEIYNPNTSANSQSHLILTSLFNGTGVSSIGSVSFALPAITATVNKFAGYFGISTGSAFTLAAPTTDFTISLRDGVSSNPVERFRILGNGFVGIGTATPDHKLHVSENTTIGTGIRIEQLGTGGPELFMTRTGGTASNWSMYLPSGTTELRMTSAFVDRFIFTSAGSFVVPTLAGTGQQGAALTSNGTFVRVTALTFDVGNNLVIEDGKSIFTGLITGTQFGGSGLQKLAFWGKTPIVQPTAAFASAVLVPVGGPNIQALDTFDGYSLPQVVAALRAVGILA